MSLCVPGSTHACMCVSVCQVQACIQSMCLCPSRFICMNACVCVCTDVWARDILGTHVSVCECVFLWFCLMCLMLNLCVRVCMCVCACVCVCVSVSVSVLGRE